LVIPLWLDRYHKVEQHTRWNLNITLKRQETLRMQ